MNLGWNDLAFDAEFLNKMRSRATFPLITSNMVYKDSGLPFGEKYIIKTVGNIRVGILGVMPLEPIGEVADPHDDSCPEKQKNQEHAHGQEKHAPFPEQLEIIPPEDALKGLLPEVRKQADLVILLSQCGYKGTALLVNKLDGIDLAISGGLKPTNKAGTSRIPIMQTSHTGKRLGYVRLTLNDAGQIIKTEDQMISLGDYIPFDGQVVKLTGDDIGKKIREDELRKMEKEAKALLELSPEKYYEMLMKEQTKTGGEK